MKVFKKQSGFTLVELLLYVAIVSNLLLALAAFFSTSLTARAKNQSIFEVNQQGQASVEYIAQTIRNSSSISAPAAGASAASLTLVVPTGSLSPTIFDLSGSTLQVKEGVAAYVPLTNSKVQVTALSFTNLSRPGTEGVVQVSITLSRVNNTGQNQFDYQKTFTTSAALR